MTLDLRQPRVLTLRVRDLDRALAFYHERLRLPVKLRVPGLAELQTDTTLVVLVESDAACGSAASPALGWEVDDLDAARERLAELGVVGGTVEEEPAPGAGRRLVLADPDGHRLEIIEQRGPLPPGRDRRPPGTPASPR